MESAKSTGFVVYVDSKIERRLLREGENSVYKVFVGWFQSESEIVVISCNLTYSLVGFG